MYPSITALMQKAKPKKPTKRHQTFQLSENIISEISYQSEILNISKTKLINHYLQTGINLTKKDKDFIKLENLLQEKNVESFEKYQSLENPKIQISKDEKKPKSAKKRTTKGA